jgi:hypothetical protein
METRFGLRYLGSLPGDFLMIPSKFALAAAALAALAVVASPAQARRHHHWHGYAFGLPYPISYSHNYGPGPEGGTFAYYDGPSTNFCAQGSATYSAQGGRYPCF